MKSDELATDLVRASGKWAVESFQVLRSSGPDGLYSDFLRLFEAGQAGVQVVVEFDGSIPAQFRLEGIVNGREVPLLIQAVRPAEGGELPH